MNIDKTTTFDNYNIIINLKCDLNPRKYLFVFQKGFNKIYLYSSECELNHTQLLYDICKKYNLTLSDLFVSGGWIKSIFDKVVFFNTSRKYNNRFKDIRVAKLIQSLFYNDSTLKDLILYKSNSKKINQLKYFKNIVHRL